MSTIIWAFGRPGVAVTYTAKNHTVIPNRIFTNTFSTLLGEQLPTPGTPECEKFSDIAKALKEIEAERQRAVQAATLPEEKK